MKIMLWKLGHLDKNNLLNSILPTKESLEKFREILKSSLATSPDGTVSLIWGPDIDVELVEIDDDVKHYIVSGDGKLVKVCDQ